ncbi:MAG: putative PurR-regulated permease PerM [Lentimonas sp.]|jgi:predicted PurR-regulated permease PerM
MLESQLTALSPAQKRIIAAGTTALALILLIATALGLFVVLQHFIHTFKDVLLPLAIAAILATLLRPIITLAEQHTRLSKTQGIILLYLLVVLAIATTTALLLPIIFNQVTELAEAAPTIRDNFYLFLQEKTPAAWEWLHARLGQSPDEYVQNIVTTHSDTITGALKALPEKIGDIGGSVGGFIGSMFGKIAAYAIIPVYLFFILNGDRNIWNDLEKQLSFFPDERRNDIVFLCRQFSGILIAFFRGQIIIGLLLGIVLAIGFGLVGLKFGIVLGLILGLLNIIPYLGTMLGIITVLPLAYFQDGGGATLIGLCAIVFTIGQLLTDYVLTPRIMGDKTGMGPMLIIFSIFFWGVALGGIMGMVLAIPLTAFILIFWRLARERYLSALTSKQIEA